ncbi:hypothetical protein [uncultured Amnibacterium sp.]|uniref:hypothetical protein n=1 Tax=uncultured Amnibacterium sp. TaxID=1631851 RepID=UPI0035C97E51
MSDQIQPTDDPPSGDQPSDDPPAAGASSKLEPPIDEKTAGSPGQTADPAVASPSRPERPATIAAPTTATGWVKPKYAVFVVVVLAVALLGVLVGSVLGLQWGSTDGGKTANANASTISAIAAATIAALSSLAAAYFGIRVATEQSAQSAQTARDAVQLLALSSPNSTKNGNPTTGDF